jgi:hypothetical protein
MGRIRNGILGSVSGKVSGVVGGQWKGISYLRGYAIPANPNTAAQQAVRGKFSFVIIFAQLILSSVINKFWEKINVGMSGYNSFCKQNFSVADAVTGLTVNNKVLTGSLESTSLQAATYTSGTGSCDITWSDTTLGNGLGSDKVLNVIYDKANNIAFVSDAAEIRVSGSESILIGAGRTAADLLCFTAFYRGTAPNYLMSNSVASFAVAL